MVSLRKKNVKKSATGTIEFRILMVNRAQPFADKGTIYVISYTLPPAKCLPMVFSN